MKVTNALVVCVSLCLIVGCAAPEPEDATAAAPVDSRNAALMSKYTTVRLAVDLGGLSENQRKMLPLLIEAAQAMDDAFWQQAYGDRDDLLSNMPAEARHYFMQSLRMHVSPVTLLFLWASFIGRPLYQRLDGIKSRIPLFGQYSMKLNRLWLNMHRLLSRRYQRSQSG